MINRYIAGAARRMLGLVALTLLAGCDPADGDRPGPTSVEYADTILLGEHIITMDPTRPRAEAVALRAETIVYVGARQQALALAGPQTRVVDLAAHALLPGFIDAHGHFSFTARLIQFANLSSPPVGEMNDIDDVVGALRSFIDDRGLGPDEWVLGYGYDDSLLAEHRHPTP